MSTQQLQKSSAAKPATMQDWAKMKKASLLKKGAEIKDINKTGFEMWNPKTRQKEFVPDAKQYQILANEQKISYWILEKESGKGRAYVKMVGFYGGKIKEINKKRVLFAAPPKQIIVEDLELNLDTIGIRYILDSMKEKKSFNGQVIPSKFTAEDLDFSSGLPQIINEDKKYDFYMYLAQKAVFLDREVLTKCQSRINAKLLNPSEMLEEEEEKEQKEEREFVEKNIEEEKAVPKTEVEKAKKEAEEPQDENIQKSVEAIFNN